MRFHGAVFINILVILTSGFYFPVDDSAKAGDAFGDQFRAGEGEIEAQVVFSSARGEERSAWDEGYFLLKGFLQQLHFFPCHHLLQMLAQCLRVQRIQGFIVVLSISTLWRL